MTERDSIDFGKVDIFRFFVDIFLPTLASLMFGASVYVADGMFVIRLDGALKFSMWVNVIVSVANIVLDYLFVFPFVMGIKGVVMATYPNFRQVKKA
ncbi:hypothetical protein AB9N12_10155 [Bacteroides sp. AN502(2024)]|uniref:hypothetical protein n=1 Tax=Bacteroides sp. AN502(2024) TaxID=3160599 RepID=UPI003514273B